MPHHRLPRKLLFDEFQDGKRSLECQKKDSKDALKVSLNALASGKTHESKQLGKDQSGRRLLAVAQSGFFCLVKDKKFLQLNFYRILSH